MRGLPLHRLLSDGRPADWPVCLDGDRVLPWQSFVATTGYLAARIEALPQKRWAICCENPFIFSCALFAVLHSGRHAVLPPNFLPGTLKRLGTEIHAVLTDSDSPVAGLPFLHAKEVQGPKASFTPLSPRKATMDLYTSGSNGEPRRIRKTLTQIEAEVATQEGLWGRQIGNAPIIATVPHHHIYGLLFRVLWPLSAGRPFDARTNVYPEALLVRLDTLGAAAVVSSPAHLKRAPEIISLAGFAPARAIFSSGAPLPAAAAEKFRRQLGTSPTEIYGSTETGGIAWRRQIPQDEAWTPLPGVQVAVADDLALLLRSPFLPQRDWWHMDDGAELLSDGRFLLTGRLDRIVKIEGKRLSLPDMEQRLQQHRWVADAGVVLLQGSRQSLGAAVALTPAGQAQLARAGRRNTAWHLRRHLADFFEAVLLPRRWRFPQQLPVNARGKLTVENLAALFGAKDDEPVVT